MLISNEQVIYLVVLMVLVSISLGGLIECVTFRKEIKEKNIFHRSFNSIRHHFF